MGALLAAGLSGQKKSKASAAASKAKDGKAPAGKAPSGIRIAQQAAAQAVDDAPKKKDSGIVFGGEDDLMMAGNMNRVSLEDGTEEATSIEGAINLLDGGGGGYRRRQRAAAQGGLKNRARCTWRTRSA